MKWLWVIPAVVVAFIIASSFYLQPSSFWGCQPTPVEASKGCSKADAIVVGIRWLVRLPGLSCLRAAGQIP